MGVTLDLDHLAEEVLEFLTERHLATLSTVRRNGTPHVVPVGFTYDAATRTARVITSGDSVKVRHAERNESVAALCQVDGARWLTLSGQTHIERNPDAVRGAEQRYAARYRVPRENPKRVVLVITVDRILGSSTFR